MRIDDYGRSTNIDDRRGRAARSGGAGVVLIYLFRFVFNRFGIGGVVVAGALLFGAYQMGINPLGMAGGGNSSSAQIDRRYDQLIGATLLSTEEVFSEIFREEGIGDYPEPTLVLFSGSVNTRGCGFASAAAGPFYCPADRQLYIDTRFFDQLAQTLGAPGDFAQAYVIAHEAGHHVQTVLGISQEVRRQQAAARTEAQANASLVRLELMADCLSGVWAGRTNIVLEDGDIEEALRAAAAVGDDTLQKKQSGKVVPDSFTHGTSEQRQRWFFTGYREGKLGACNTLTTQRL